MLGTTRVAALRMARRYARQAIASLVNDRRHVEPRSYQWLNRLTARLISQDGAAERRPYYAWGVVHAAALARALQIERISVIEFGVAGGHGLLQLERISERVETILGVVIDVYGFDTGAGLPKPDDNRDLPNLFLGGDFPMDVPKLKLTLRRSQLVLGPIRDTIDSFLAAKPAPLGFVSIDVDFYSSAMDALRIFDADEPRLLPRVHCYMDDIMGLTFGHCNGERLAMRVFNDSHPTRQISPIYGLRYHLPWPLSTALWPEMMFMTHIMDHELYGQNDGLLQKRTAGLNLE